MMMKALEAGGLDAAYRSHRDKLVTDNSDEFYSPNEGGLYELSRQDYALTGFPRKWDGKLIKALKQSVVRMAVMRGGIRCVFMRRDAEEIRQSFMGFFNNNLPIGSDFQTTMDIIVEQIRNRKDVISCHEFYYRDVVADPLKHFEILQDDGWPIDAQKCVGVVESRLCHYRRENLTEGII